MSQILDQLLIEDIAKYCPQNFVNYHQCIQQNHDNPQNCVPQQQELASCIKTKVPAFQKILSQCGTLLRDYETCMRTKRDETCVVLLKEIRSCAEGCVDLTKNTANTI